MTHQVVFVNLEGITVVCGFEFCGITRRQVVVSAPSLCIGIGLAAGCAPEKRLELGKHRTLGSTPDGENIAYERPLMVITLRTSDSYVSLDNTHALSRQSVRHAVLNLYTTLKNIHPEAKENSNLQVQVPLHVRVATPPSSDGSVQLGATTSDNG
jgi:hypothetical protein